MSNDHINSDIVFLGKINSYIVDRDKRGLYMRFSKKVPHHRDVRITTYFAWFPVCIIQNEFTVEEWRWLETVTVKQEWLANKWVNIKFID